MEMLQGVWTQHLRLRAVVGYGVKIFLPSPPSYVTRSPGMFFKGVYTDDWMVPWVVVRKVFLALLFPNLIVSLVTAANEIINQQHAATNCNRKIFLPCTI